MMKCRWCEKSATGRIRVTRRRWWVPFWISFQWLHRWVPLCDDHVQEAADYAKEQLRGEGA